jgi:hypothetical protein
MQWMTSRAESARPEARAVVCRREVDRDGRQAGTGERQAISASHTMLMPAPSPCHPKV